MVDRQRTCIVCRRSAGKSELLRFVWSESRIVWDSDRKLPGRGGYIHPNWSCVCKMSELRFWQRCFRMGNNKPPKDCFQEALRQVRDLVLGSSDLSVNLGRPNKPKIRI